ncbi:transmembrane protein, putative, partial (macronuclear) [Tetrahymena thermophila SB210]
MAFNYIHSFLINQLSSLAKLSRNKKIKKSNQIQLNKNIQYIMRQLPHGAYIKFFRLGPGQNYQVFSNIAKQITGRLQFLLYIFLSICFKQKYQVQIVNVISLHKTKQINQYLIINQLLYLFVLFIHLQLINQLNFINCYSIFLKKKINDIIDQILRRIRRIQKLFIFISLGSPYQS